ncbi:hypothetical protein ACPCA8_34415 [Streptomyces capoamus]|uniref:hypothetical protein n=1 Tax=Streptomyces capoamus TaxID=68183 RepID=UPI003C308404
MHIGIACRSALVAVLLSFAAVPASAAGDGARADRSCGDLRLTGSLPAPPVGMAVQQEVSIGVDCRPRLGEVRLTPLGRAGATAAGAGTKDTESGRHRLSSWNEMYDCCNIRMTALYLTSHWATEGGRVVSADADATQQWNREPWDAGWSRKSATEGVDCATGCPVSRSEAHADFTYRGIFDATGAWYANTHHSYVDLKADGTAFCHFEVNLRHTFIGWNWRRGCA